MGNNEPPIKAKKAPLDVQPILGTASIFCIGRYCVHLLLGKCVVFAECDSEEFSYSVHTKSFRDPAGPSPRAEVLIRSSPTTY